MTKSFSSFSIGAAIGAAALTLATAIPAQALTFTPTSAVPYLGNPALGPVTDRSPANIFDFNSLALGSFTTTSKNGTTLTAAGDVEVRSGGSNNFAPPSCSPGDVFCANPAGASSNTSAYLSIGTGGSLTATFSKAAKYIGFAWGYADNRDSVLVNWLDSLGVAQSQEFTNKIFTTQEDSTYIDILAGVDESITSVIWSKKGNGRFEIDNIAVVPTPALLPGLIGMGVAALRKRKQTGEAQEA